jgi:hypothetical protein
MADEKVCPTCHKPMQPGVDGFVPIAAGFREVKFPVVSMSVRNVIWCRCMRRLAAYEIHTHQSRRLMIATASGLG